MFSDDVTVDVCDARVKDEGDSEELCPVPLTSLGHQFFLHSRHPPQHSEPAIHRSQDITFETYFPASIKISA